MIDNSMFVVHMTRQLWALQVSSEGYVLDGIVVKFLVIYCYILALQVFTT